LVSDISTARTQDFQFFDGGTNPDAASSRRKIAA
jgi:hypothetical protein